MTRWIRLSAAVVASVAAAQPLTLDEVLFRANEMVVAYERLLSRAVTEERYLQRVLRPDGSVERERTLLCELVIMRLPGEEIWRGFRDVIEVDGSPLRERDGRLAALLAGQAQDAVRQATEITTASNKHFLRPPWSGATLPTLGLTILHALNQHRFYFERAGDDTVGGAQVWAVRFSEHVRPSMMSMGVNVFTRGTLWIDPSSGGLAKSEIVIGDQNTPLQSSLSTMFRRDEGLQVWIPAELHEMLETPRQPAADRVETHATYGPFRSLMPAGGRSGTRR